ncbi:patatin [Nordella sp. HKS 07]|uniref:patatin-like phospholipase family protein n=1 Tax=Nordella sp. HKS 07 TaxID=2712222 RepID=UPI0013E102AF|nr:patatin-like phospholipase family protein [Nordella sp. HKS 07]QIG48933.1 patatin [Nordella sp. HKS 07]
MAGRRLFSSFLIGAAGLFLLSGCGASLEELRTPVPEPLVAVAHVPGYKQVRFWGDDGNSVTPAYIEAGAAQIMRAAKTDRTINPYDRKFLAISGGGSNGAFGAGLLVGWTAAGTRPHFDIVTGVSTGSLIAPFAFVGSAYDRHLREVYTETSGKDIYKTKGILSIIGSESAADNTPLKNMVARYMTDRLIADIVREHAKGRRLLIGTTNIDAERPVIWDIGAIASSRDPNRVQLIRDILVASASIPVVFPPVRLNVVADGHRYDELHVDGGTSNQSFLFPSNFTATNANILIGRTPKRTLYVIRNGKVNPEWSAVKPRIAAIAGKSIASLIKTQGIGDLYRLYSNAQRDKIDYNAIWVPASFELKEKEPFDPVYMRALYKLGYEMGKNGIPWEKHPP